MEFKKALNRAMQICSRREQCEYDIRNKMQNLDLADEEIEKIILLLKKDKFIDDERYLQYFINDKIQFNKWGIYKIDYALKHKGFKAYLIENALAKIQSENYFEVILSELRKKKKSIKEQSQLKVKAKLYAFGRSRGYESELIYKAIDQLIESDFS